jgi:hypothetical protein
MGVNSIFVKQFFKKKLSKNKRPWAFIRGNTIFFVFEIFVSHFYEEMLCTFFDIFDLVSFFLPEGRWEWEP